VLIVLGVLSRLFSLEVYRRISASPVRDVTRSVLPGTPWFTVESDRVAVKVIVTLTYTSVLLGMVLVTIGVLGAIGD
jgi:hypothetical protein